MGISGTLNMGQPLGTREGKLTLLAIILMLYVIAIFLSIAIHEVLGHGMFAELLGGEMYAVYLSPSNGYTSFYLPDTMTSAEVALTLIAGMAIQIIIGCIVLFLVLPRVRGFLAGLFTLQFAVGLLVHSSLYLALGHIYLQGDTRVAALVLGIEPDAFMVAGLVLTGLFVLLISMAALRFLGRFADLGDDRERNVMLLMFWYPQILLGGLEFLASALRFPDPENAYSLLFSIALLLFTGVALLLVPKFSEPVFEREQRVTMRGVLAVGVCFMLLIAGWAGVFGLSRESAHGLLLREPPAEVEYHYSDYTIGNANVHLYLNGTVRVEMILRNMMESPSPLEGRIYNSFNERPDWDRYIERSRNLLVGMFDLKREVGENLSFTTGMANVFAGNVTNVYGRSSVTYIGLAQMGTRQYFPAPGEQEPAHDADIVLDFVDPWKYQGGFLDRVTVGWDENMTCVLIDARNMTDASIIPTLGGQGQGFVGWDNIDPQAAPISYVLKFNTG